jgi:hypothetical protein
VDSCSIRAVHGGDQIGPNPTDRAKCGSKRHLICDGRGVPLAVRLTGANRKRLARSPGVSRCYSPATRRTGPTATAADLCSRESRLRRDGDSARAAGAACRAAARDASHPAWEWLGPVALGCGAHICVAQSVSPLARAV